MYRAWSGFRFASQCLICFISISFAGFCLAASANFGSVQGSSETQPNGEGSLDSNSPSSDARSTKEFGFAGTSGFVGGGINASGFELVHLLGAPTQLGFGYMRGTRSAVNAKAAKSNECHTAGFLTSECEHEVTLITAHVRHFLGNSFNVRLALGTEQHRINYRAKSDSQQPDEISVEKNGVDFISTVSIGNHWTWPNGFNLGVDWVGVDLIPWSKGSKSTTHPSKGGKVISTTGGGQGWALVALCGTIGFLF